jgi:hypothetical protein
VLSSRAETPPRQHRVAAVSPVLLVGPAITRFAVRPGPGTLTSSAAPATLARVLAQRERVLRAGTTRVEGSTGPPGLPGAHSPGVPGPPGDTGERGRAGADGLTLVRSPDLVVRVNPPAAPAAGRREPPAAAAAEARPAPRPADWPAPSSLASPSIEEITTQVIRRIERRATAQRERLARPRG